MQILQRQILRDASQQQFKNFQKHMVLKSNLKISNLVVLYIFWEGL